MTGRPSVAVVIATRNRRRSLCASLRGLVALPARPRIVVVDNGSTDGTAAAVRAQFPSVQVIELGRNRGAVARNYGARLADEPTIAFADDDSRWTPGSLARAEAILKECPDVAAVVARVELDPDGVVDPVSAKHRRNPVGTRAGPPGPETLSFPAFALVIRRDVFWRVGGFSGLLFFGGEEQLLAADVAAAGWRICYVDDVVARHAPANPAASPDRWALQTRNDLLVNWMRRPLTVAARETGAVAVRGRSDPAARRAVLGLARKLPAALRHRRNLGPRLEQMFAAGCRPP